eukprot:scaffold5819_cov115-Isochrysis_galbana.AAC.3
MYYCVSDAGAGANTFIQLQPHSALGDLLAPVVVDAVVEAHERVQHGLRHCRARPRTAKCERACGVAPARQRASRKQNRAAAK